MNELNNWLEEMKTPSGKDGHGDAKTPEDVREVKYNKPGTVQSLFNPGNQPVQSEGDAKAEGKKSDNQPEQDKPQPMPQPQPQPQSQQKPEPQPEQKSGVELALEAALKAVAEDAKQRKTQQQQREQQEQEQKQQPQQNPQALDDLTKRVEVLEEHDLTHANNFVKTRDAIDKTSKLTLDVDKRVVDIEANDVGQQTFQDSIDAFESKLAQISKPTIIKIGEKPEVKIDGMLHPIFKRLVQKLTRHGQAYLVGPAGSGKTTLGEQAAQALSLDFGFISCSAGMAEAHLLGRMIANGTYLPSRFVELYENGGLFLFDEVDAADANTMLVLNSALANGYLSVPNRQGQPVARRHASFKCLVAANTLGTGSFEFSGRVCMDAAFLDRFALSRLLVDYNLDLERSFLAGDAEFARVLHKVRFNLEATKTRRVVSTRAFRDAAVGMLDGDTPQQVIDDLMLGWQTEEKTRAMKDVVVPKTSPLKQLGLKQLEAAKTLREQEAANLKKVALAQKEADSIERSKHPKKELELKPA